MMPKKNFQHTNPAIPQLPPDQDAIITHIRGGLGNQLFMYALGRAHSLTHKLPLFLESTTGFKRDFFKRSFALQHFNCNVQSIPRPHRYIISHFLSRTPLLFPRKQFIRLGFLVQGQPAFGYDEDLVRYSRIARPHRLDIFGYWHNELYFNGHKDIIRQDLQLKTVVDRESREIATKILRAEAVCVHVRRLRESANRLDARPKSGAKAIPREYYQRCIADIIACVPNAQIFCFSDYKEGLEEWLRINQSVTVIAHNNSEDRSHVDLWLMSLCKHFVISNSTFGWWGAWLSCYQDKIVFCPDVDEFAGGAAPAEGWRMVKL